MLAQSLDSLVTGAIDQTSEEIIALNQQQLYSGRLSDGSFVSPTYQEDPYFKTPEAAQRYSDWKDTITPNDERPPGVPNLFINGQFYSTWRVRASGSKILFESSDPNAPDIEERFGARIYGLDDDSMDQYRSETFFPVLRERITAETELTFS